MFALALPGLAWAGGTDRFGFPDVSERIGVFADQLPNGMSDGQARFSATHYVGAQKLVLPITRRLRRYKPGFVVIHYHLGIWQQQPRHTFIVDGRRWGNDWPEVTRHEDWFWHNARGERVRSSSDGKYLMNIAHPGFREYWKRSIARQCRAGRYQGVFLDSSSVDMLHAEARQMDPRLKGRVAVRTRFKELGGATWREAYESFMAGLTRYLEEQGFATIPNINAQFTTWDTTDYFSTASGAFVERAWMTRNADDWVMANRRVLRLVRNDNIVIFQPYLRKGDQDVGMRTYLLACYLLLKGRYTYINYFARKVLSWYPEYEVNLGKPLKPVPDMDDLARGRNLFQRQYARGEVWVNAGNKARSVEPGGLAWRVVPEGGGPVPGDGKPAGNLRFEPVRKIELGPWSGAVLLYEAP